MVMLRTIKTLADINLTGSLTATGEGATETSDNVDVRQTAYFWFYVDNLGASTDLTVILYGRSTTTGIDTPIGTFNLNASTVLSGSKFVEKNPGYCYVKATNNDTGNATTYNVQIETVRG